MKQQRPQKGMTVTLSELIALRFQAHTMVLSNPHRNIKHKTSRSAEHHVLALGRGLEFAEARAYQAGDDIRTMDWRVTARTGKPHTKLYQEERERPVFLAVDYGSDMFFGTRVAFKSVVAAQAAALVAWMAMEKKYRVGSLIFSDEKHMETQPQSGEKGVLPILQSLASFSMRGLKRLDFQQGAAKEGNRGIRVAHEDCELSGNAFQNKSQAMTRLHRIAMPGSTLFLITDFSGFDETTEKQLSRLASHCKIVVIFIYDPIEKNLPEEQQYLFTNQTQFQSIDCTNKNTQKSYRKQFDEREHYLKKRCLQWRIPFISLATNDDLVSTLSRGLLGVLR